MKDAKHPDDLLVVARDESGLVVAVINKAAEEVAGPGQPVLDRRAQLPRIGMVARLGGTQLRGTIRSLLPPARSMRYHLRLIDWPLLFFAVLGCYVLPSVFLGTLVPVLFAETNRSDPSSLVASGYFLVLVVPPVLSGWFTAAYAKTLPRFHVGVMGLLGAVYSLVMTTHPVGPTLVMVAGMFALVCLGAFMQLRGRRARH